MDFGFPQMFLGFVVFKGILFVVFETLQFFNHANLFIYLLFPLQFIQFYHPIPSWRAKEAGIKL